MKDGLHDKILAKTKECFLSQGFRVREEVLLDEGKGAADVFATNGLLSFYCEVKSSPASINKKKVFNQLKKYKTFFGDDNQYLLVSPGADGSLRASSLETRETNELNNYICSCLQF